MQVDNLLFIGESSEDMELMFKASADIMLGLDHDGWLNVDNEL